SVVSPPPRQQKELQDSQLFDAEYSETLMRESSPSSQQITPRPAPAVPAPRRRGTSGSTRWPRGMEVNVLYG
ncbi:hypothetical protein M9458_034319, partial [Cirrhinus mrigala]